MPPYLPPLQDHGPAPSVPSLLRVAGMSDKHARPWVIVCANGADHRDYGVGKVSVAAYEQLAVDACEFMDAKRKNNPWECGPHTVRRSSCP